MAGWLSHLASLHRVVVSGLGEAAELRSSDGSSAVAVTAIYEAPAEVEEVHGAEHVYSRHVVTLRLSEQPAWMARGVTITLTARTPPVVLKAVEGTPDGQGLISWTARVP